MALKRLVKKTLLGFGNPIIGHLNDASLKQAKTGKSYWECLGDSIKETLTEDLPGTSHIYRSGYKDGKKDGTIEQAERDEKKFQTLHRKHEEDRAEWNRINKEKDRLLDELGEMLD